MYNLSGLYYQLKSDGLILGIGALIFLMSSCFWIPDKRNYKELIIGMVSISLCICFIGYHSYIIHNPQISIHEGVFVSENRLNPYLFRMEYCFSSSKGLKPVFHLDIFSKKQIYPNEMEKNVRYRIYYEKRTDVIVRIQKLEYEELGIEDI